MRYRFKDKIPTTAVHFVLHNRLHLRDQRSRIAAALSAGAPFKFYAKDSRRLFENTSLVIPALTFKRPHRNKKVVQTKRDTKQVELQQKHGPTTI